MCQMNDMENAVAQPGTQPLKPLESPTLVDDEPKSVRYNTFTNLFLGLSALLTLHAVHFLLKEPVDIGFKTVWCSAWITAASTGLGAIPFYFFENPGKPYVATANALAAGMMISASIGLLCDALGTKDSADSIGAPVKALIGMWLGVVFIVFSEKYVGGLDHDGLLKMDSFDAKKICLIMAAMTIHSFSEGVGIGVSYHSQTLGALVSTTLAIHNIPEGIALSIVLIPRGVTKASTTLFCIISSAPQPLMAVTSYIFVDTFKNIVSLGLGFAAGAMVYVAIVELFQEAREVLGFVRASMVLVTSGMAMGVMQVWLAM